MMNNLYNKILNEVYLVQDFDSWDNTEQTFKGAIKDSLRCFVFKTTMDELKLYNCDWEGCIRSGWWRKVRINGKLIPDSHYIGFKPDYSEDPPGILNVKYYGKIGDAIYMTIDDIDDMPEDHCKYMFMYCKDLISVPLWNTENITSMKSMFEGCESLKAVPLFNTKNVRDMIHMFSGCKNLENVPKFDTRSLTGKVKNGRNYTVPWAYMFYNCWSLNKETLKIWKVDLWSQGWPYGNLPVKY